MTVASVPRVAWQVLLAAVAFAAALAALSFIVFGASPMTLAAVAAAVAPIAIYVALQRPLEFLLGLYVLLIPFDNLLGTGSFGSLTKLLGIVAGAFLLLWLARRRSVSFAGGPTVVLLALMAWMLASAFWAIDQGAALSIMQTYAGLMLLYFVLTMVPVSLTQFRILLGLVVAGGLCAAVYGIHAFYGDPTIQQQSPQTVRLVVEVGQSHIDPNHFADALLLPIAIVTMLGLRSRRIVAKLACLAGLATLVAAILFSGSREGLSAVLLIAVYYLWRSRYRLQLLIAAAIGVVASAFTQASVFERFATALDTGGSGRTSIWAVAVEAIKHRFLFGYGIGNFPQAFNLFYLHVRQDYPFGWDSPAHNLILHYFVEIGLVGVVLLALFFIAQFRSLKVIQAGSDLYDYRLMMEAGLLATLGVAMTIDLFTYKYAWLVFSMIALLRNAQLQLQRNATILPTSSRMMPARSARSSTRDFPDSPSPRSVAVSSAAS